MTVTATRLCVTCGEYVTGQGRRLYCRDECAQITKTCAECGEEYRTSVKRRRRPCCSMECGTWYRARDRKVEKVTCSCGECGKTFQKYPSEIAEGRGRFCSRTCSMVGRPINGRPSVIGDEVLDLVESAGLLVDREVRVGRWSLDAVPRGTKVAIELDGEFWHSLPDMVDRDQRKDAYLTSRGWQVIRVVMRAHETASEIAARLLEVIQHEEL